MKKPKLPCIGLRTVKTSLVVFIALLYSILRDGKAQAFDVAFAAILCIQPTMDSLKNTAKNRLYGTFIGGMWGSLIFILNFYFLRSLHPIIIVGFISVSIIPVIYTILIIKKYDSVPIACATYLILNLNSFSVDDPFFFLVNRLFDTFVGVAIAFFVNLIKLPKQENLPDSCCDE